MSARKKGVSPKQIKRVRELSEQGYSTVQIQRTLSKEHLGLRRTVLLGYVREFKGRPAQRNVSKYTPKKYSRTCRPREKVISLSGTVHGKDRRINLSATDGRTLRRALIEGIFGGGEAKRGYSPKSQFLTIDAHKLLSNPSKYLEKEEWDTRPRINS